MSRLADDLRRELRQRAAALSPGERIEMALALGDCDLELFCITRAVSREEGRRILQRRRQLGRRPSCAQEE